MTTLPSNESTLLARLLESLADCLTYEVAERIAALSADAALQARVDELAGNNSEGTLADAERSEYESCVHATQFISILQAKARKLVRQHDLSQV